MSIPPRASGPNSCLYRPSVRIGGITGAGKINSGKQCAMEIWFCICNHIYCKEDYCCFEFSTDRHSLPLPWSHLVASRKPFGPVGGRRGRSLCEAGQRGCQLSSYVNQDNLEHSNVAVHPLPLLHPCSHSESELWGKEPFIQECA